MEAEDRSGQAAQGRGKLRVLVFDDDLVTAFEGHEVDGVELHLEGDTEGAALVIEEAKPHLVLMDHSFGRFGRCEDEAIRDLRRRWPADELMIIGISSSELGNRALLAAGANTCMPKQEVRAYLLGLATAEARR
jgi:hypothetical protein